MDHFVEFFRMPLLDTRYVLTGGNALSYIEVFCQLVCSCDTATSNELLSARSTSTSSVFRTRLDSYDIYVHSVCLYVKPSILSNVRVNVPGTSYATKAQDKLRVIPIPPLHYFDV